ncbi:Protein Malvolio [Nymphon striatum]|nr:Protein Malvolio [Nymphon striatum]
MFATHQVLAIQRTCLVPAALVSLTSDEAQEKLTILIKLYKDGLPSPGTIKSEANCWQVKWKDYVVVAPDQLEIAKGLFIPNCQNCNSAILLQAIGAIGAVIMPHNLYLHSALVKSRVIDRTKRAEIKDVNRYYFIESTIALALSLIINLMVVAVFAAGVSGHTEAEVFEICKENNPLHSDVFRGVFLGCKFGLAAMYIWAIGIMAAGQSSTMTGTYSGQFVMELPFALIPTLTFTASQNIMGPHFKNKKIVNILACIVAVGIIAINLTFMTFYLQKVLPSHWGTYLAIIVVVLCYVSFVLYLILGKSLKEPYVHGHQYLSNEIALEPKYRKFVKTKKNILKAKFEWRKEKLLISIQIKSLKIPEYEI